VTEGGSQEALKLKVEDAEDLEVASSVLQDAVVPVADIDYFPERQCFALVANRFCWERHQAQPLRKRGERVLCGVTFHNVTGVARRGLDKRRPGDFLSLLAIRNVANDRRSTVELVFSGDTAIRLDVTRLDCHVEDFDEPWPTLWRPRHGDA
jgi:hypothetical protein